MRYRFLKIAEHGEVVSYRFPDGAIMAEVAVYVAISEPFVAHEIKMIRGLQISPDFEELLVSRFFSPAIPCF